MTARTKSPEAPVAVSPDGAPKTPWGNMVDSTSNDETLPPSFPPANRHMASPETASAESLPPSFPPQSGGVEGQGQNTDEHVTDPTDIDGKKGTYGLIKSPDGELLPYKVKARSSGSNLPDNIIIDTRLAQNAGEQTSADAGMSYEDRGRQIIAGATERAKAGGKELFGRAGAGIKRIAGKLVRLARGGVKTVGETAGKGASVVVGFAAIEGPRAAKATAETVSEAREKSAQKISELAKSARERRKLRRNNREAAKAWREREYKDRQRVREEALGALATRVQNDAWIEAKIKEESAERGDNIETLEDDISEQGDKLEMKEAEVEAAESRVRKAERRLKKLEAKKKRAEERRDQAKEISDKNPDDVDAEIALRRAEGDLSAIEEQYSAASTIKTRLEGKKVDLSSELGTTRTRLGEIQGNINVLESEIETGREWLRSSRAERIRDKYVSPALIMVREFVDGSTAAHDLLRRAGRAIKRKFQGGNRQEAKTAA